MQTNFINDKLLINGNNNSFNKKKLQINVCSFRKKRYMKIVIID